MNNFLYFHFPYFCGGAWHNSPRVAWDISCGGWEPDYYEAYLGLRLVRRR